jgi:hypothetical protein
MKIEIISITELPDGSANIEVSLDQEYKDHLKKIYGLKRWSNKALETFVNQSLRHLLDKIGAPIE